MVARNEYLFVFCYDISRNKTRKRVARILEDKAVRVQGSVFEARMSDRSAKNLGDDIAFHLEPGDSLRVYRINASSLSKIRVVGAGAPPEQNDFYLF